jgi:hypothetical protein
MFKASAGYAIAAFAFSQENRDRIGFGKVFGFERSVLAMKSAGRDGEQDGEQPGDR